MSDYMAAEIHIGGKICRSVAKALCEVIAAAGASLEWGGGQFHPKTPDELHLARSANNGGPLLLKLYDDQARWGEFNTLERFLREHDIAYCRWSDGKYEYDPEGQAFHPDCGLVSWLTDHERHPMVLVSHLTPIKDRLTKVLEFLKQSGAETARVLTDIKKATDCLCDELPPAVPSLETLEIVED